MNIVAEQLKKSKTSQIRLAIAGTLALLEVAENWQEQMALKSNLFDAIDELTIRAELYERSQVDMSKNDLPSMDKESI